MDLVVSPDADTASAQAAHWMARRVRRAVSARGRADVAFSGGTTPELMLGYLATMDLAWEHVHVYQVDERVAAPGDPARNAGLLAVLPVPSRQLHLMGVGAQDLRAAARRYGARLPEVLDVVHLGLGDDGHTASWAPGDTVIDEQRRVGLSGVFNGWVRMTLTPLAVNAARARLVLVTGASKAPALGSWLAGHSEAPIARLRRSGTTVMADAFARGTQASGADH